MVGVIGSGHRLPPMLYFASTVDGHLPGLLGDLLAFDEQRPRLLLVRADQQRR